MKRREEYLERRGGIRRAVTVMRHKGLLAAMMTWADICRVSLETDRLHRRAAAVFDKARRVVKHAVNTWAERTKQRLEMRRYLHAVIANGLHKAMVRWRRATRRVADARAVSARVMAALERVSIDHFRVHALRYGMDHFRSHARLVRAARSARRHADGRDCQLGDLQDRVELMRRRCWWCGQEEMLRRG